jgi:hypothetical protein
MKIKKKKLAQSEVISAVLLILIVIIAVFIVIGFIFPFVKNQLSESDCIKVIDKIGISENSKYTCYDSTNSELRVQIYLGDILDQMNSFRIETGGAETTSVDIVAGAEADAGILCMFSDCLKTIELPGKNEQKTYVLKSVLSKPDIIKVYPVLKTGKICSSSNSVTSVPDCGSI